MISRNIPKKIKKEVRARCGYGCVICGNAIYEYHHIEDYYIVKCHEVNNIVLLCPNHHARITRKFIDQEELSYRYKNPLAIERGYADDTFYNISSTVPAVIGSNKLSGDSKSGALIIDSAGEKLMWLNKPENCDAPAGFSSIFYDKHGLMFASIINNEFRINIKSKNFLDFETTGGRYDFQFQDTKSNLAISRKNGSLIFNGALYCRGNALHMENECMKVIQPNGKYNTYIVFICITMPP